jgi:hypothetical protein
MTIEFAVTLDDLAATLSTEGGGILTNLDRQIGDRDNDGDAADEITNISEGF